MIVPHYSGCIQWEQKYYLKVLTTSQIFWGKKTKATIKDDSKDPPIKQYIHEHFLKNEKDQEKTEKVLENVAIFSTKEKFENRC